MHEEEQYLNLIRKIFNNGSLEHGRNGNIYSIFGESMKFDLKDGTIPLLTTKRVAWKTCFKELIWFISGCTDNQILKDQNVNIWNDNASREFLDSRGLQHLEENDLGPVYGHQWRHFNADYENRHTDYSGKGIDQLSEVINQLKNKETQTSRRLIVSAWNPCQINQMALPPCHVLMQFHVREHKYLSCSLYQRSGDVGLGVPFNIASYSFLTHIIAKHCDLLPDTFVYFLGNAHIYEEHIEQLKIQVTREPYVFPKLDIIIKHDNINDYSLNDIFFKTDYKYHETIKMKMIA
jgi:thymidylate synthase